MATPESELPKAYDPTPVEGRIYTRWLENGAFAPPAAPARPPFSIVMPPPNVTGRLHMGHALDNTFQDVFTRWHRMQGDTALWLPGTDHAGIATQAVVERRLQREGQSRRGMGRSAFVARVWEWKGEYEADIVAQLRRLGCSCDWGRQRFTLDEGLSRAVEEVFVRYHREGLLYRGERIVNWCPGCSTAISDIEVDHRDEPGTLYHIRYPLVGGGEVIIATVRPETMLGDTAVAVHPDDQRYAALLGREVELPLVGRRIPVIADAHVLPEFGTGALKVTPAHDADDFAIGGRHGLPVVPVIGTDARLTEAAGTYAGLDRFAARGRVVEDLRAQGYLVREEPYTVALGRCERCDTVIEPLISLQWFVRVAPLVEPLLAALRAGDLVLVPERFTRQLEVALENEHDWCVSRQLWWGHRIPAWYCSKCAEVIVAPERDAPTRCPHCGAADPQRDPDVLDTWFSSALWPFSTLGWPEATADLRRYYPTDLLVTGYDILYKWVMKMAWSGLRFTGRLPFRTVLLHGLVRDAQGRKMSKSLGNGIDPLEVIDRYGADALRLTLLVGVAPGNDSRFLPERLEGSQRFCNKLWNAARFVLGAPTAPAPAGPLELPDRWILSRLARAAADATAALARFDPGEACSVLQAFVWDEFCDWYVEAVKARLFLAAGPASAAAARQTLHQVLGASLRLLHPFAPFITEEIWGQLPLAEGLLVSAPWPLAGEWPADPEAEAAFDRLRQIVGAVRSLRAEMRVQPGVPVAVLVSGEGSAAALDAGEPIALSLGRMASIQRRRPAPGEVGVSAVVGAGVEVVLLLGGLVDVAAEAERLGRELAGAEQERRRTASRLGHPEFRTRAKPEVVARETERCGALEATVARLSRRVAELGAAGEGGAKKQETE